MVLTREQSKNAFEHILTVVFGLTPTDPLVQALAVDQIEDIEEFLSLPPRQIEALSVVDAITGAATPVRKPRRNLIHAFRQYLIHQEQIGDPIDENWTSITKEEFDSYRRSPALIASQKIDDFNFTSESWDKHGIIEHVSPALTFKILPDNKVPSQPNIYHAEDPKSVILLEEPLLVPLICLRLSSLTMTPRLSSLIMTLQLSSRIMTPLLWKLGSQLRWCRLLIQMYMLDTPFSYPLK
jgi:hypothetical protein